MHHPFRILSVALGALVIAGNALAATVVIQNVDGAGEGFNDPTVVAPVGGNPGTTLGAQRLNAFTYAANLWATCLQSNVTILVRARMDPQTCTATAAILGSAGTINVARDFAGAPLPNTWYSMALANSLAGSDLDPGVPDIDATFNSNLNGQMSCLNGHKWYLGYDSLPTGGDIDFISVVTHEIGHGLGFQTFVSQAGVKLAGFNDQYMVKLDLAGGSPSTYSAMTDAQRSAANVGDPNLRWIATNVDAFLPTIPVTGGLSGGHIRMSAPNPYVAGSSVSHFAAAVTPNQIMEPAYTGANHNISLTLQLFKDEGWVLAPPTTVNDIDTLTVTQTPTSWDLKVKIANTGTGVANSVVAVMSGGPAWLSFPDPNGGYPNLAAGASSFNTDAYTLDLTNWPGGSFQVNLQVSWVDACGSHSQTVVVDLKPSAPATGIGNQPSFVSRLDANVPNPFNPSTTIHYQIGESGRATLRIYDVSGALVRTLVDRSHNPGEYDAHWDGRNSAGKSVSSGVYFYRLETNGFTGTKRMVLLK
jgi:FlgD Ig-like domain